MKKIKAILIFISICLIAPDYSLADEDLKILSSDATITARTIDGKRQSAKFEEYREIPDGISSSILTEVEGKEGYYLDIRAKDIAEDDQDFTMIAGKYGNYKVGIDYNKIPHKFAYDARTLYSGVGTGVLTIANSIQTDVENQSTTGTNARVTALRNYVGDSSFIDLKLTREQLGLGLDVASFSPVKLKFEFNNEERRGTRPFFASFGMGNPIEVPEPIDYTTRDYRVTAEYVKKQFYLNAAYHLSTFENKIDTLIWDNPLQGSESVTTASGTGVTSTTPARGRIDLYPNNNYQNFSLTGSYSELPMKTRISAIASWGTMTQNDSLIPYTINSAITDGMAWKNAKNPLPSGATTTYNSGNLDLDLPRSSANAEVKTTLYNVLLSSSPLDMLDLKLRYRSYDHKNNTPLFELPALYAFDSPSIFVSPFETEPTSFKKDTYGVDLGFNVFTATQLTLSYANDKMHRSHNREATDQTEGIYKIALDTAPVSLLSIRTSYEMSSRTGDYDYLAPFGHTINGYAAVSNTSISLDDPQTLPWLKKYDEANRDRNRLQFLATLYPTESLSITGSYIYGNDNFKDSAFGLKEDNHSIYSFDVNYILGESFDIAAFYSYETYKNKMKGRQSSPGMAGGLNTSDAFNQLTTEDSYSNWEDENLNNITTWGASANYSVIPKELNIGVSYAYTKSDGEIKFTSAVGSPLSVSTTSPSNYDINAWTPATWAKADDSEKQSLDANLKYNIVGGLSFILGYAWEKFDMEDFNLDGFTYVPAGTVNNGPVVNSTGTAVTSNAGTAASSTTYRMVNMGTLTKDYDVKMGYVKITYRF